MKKITVSQIAKKAEVSSATVSRVLNHRELVKESTILRVESAMRELGCKIEKTVTVARETQPLIVMNIPGIENVFYQEVIRGARVSAKAHGCHLIIHESHLNKGNMVDFCNLLRRVNAAGVILLNRLSVENLELIRNIAPLVQCCEYNEEAEYPYVSIDDVRAAEIATEYLLANGGHKTAMINGPLSFKYARKRQEGFMNALEKAQITIPRQWVVQIPEVNYDMAYAAVCRLLNADTHPNAFFTISDVFAAAVIRAAKRFHLHVPRDIIVVGFDNIEFSAMTTPSITTVNQPKFQMGYTACEMLLELMEDPYAEMRSLLLDTELVIRESTC